MYASCGLTPVFSECSAASIESPLPLFGCAYGQEGTLYALPVTQQLDEAYIVSMSAIREYRAAYIAVLAAWLTESILLSLLLRLVLLTPLVRLVKCPASVLLITICVLPLVCGAPINATPRQQRPLLFL